MAKKITLITPPDIYQNSQDSILLIDLTEKEQDEVSNWLGQNPLSINIYFYQGETNIPWLMHALSCANYKYINLNNMSAVSSYLSGYIVSKSGVYYNTTDDNVAILYSHINMNRIDNAVEFLERTVSGKE
jgi:hypothetical protein